jgi:microcystin-dependent protein
MKRPVIVFTLLAVFITIVFVSGALCDVPNTLNFQGRLTDNLGQGVSGTKSITFRLYDVPSGGTAFWTEAQTVTLSDGQFSVVLGKTTTLDPDDLTGETYIGIQVESDAEMAPRQKFTSVPYAIKSGDTLPAGVIVMWSGETGDIPEGWALCDGNNGTPNLKDRFVVGAGNTYPVGEALGEARVTLKVDEMPIHTHIQNAHTHVQDPHTHFVQLRGDGDNGAGAYNAESNDSSLSSSYNTNPATATNQSTVAVNQNAGGGLSHNNLPPYYALCFIMKL